MEAGDDDTDMLSQELARLLGLRGKHKRRIKEMELSQQTGLVYEYEEREAR